MTMKNSRKALLLPLAACFAAATLLAVPADGLAGREVKGNTRTNVNSNTNKNVNVNSNRNTNVNVNRNVDIDVDVDRHHGHPIATAAAVTATAIVVGSMVRTLPPNCSQVMVGNVLYQQCGGYWYQPQYAGSSVTYVVVNPPR
jgi:hypothetical protein